MDPTTAFFRHAIDSSVTGISFADLRGLVTYANRAFLEMWGFDHLDEVTGRRLVALSGQADHASEIINAVIEHGSWVGESVASKGNGTPFTVEITYSLVHDASGLPVGITGAFRDVTERARARDALQESEEKYRLLVESAVDPMFTSDADGRYLYVNPAAAASLDTTQEDLVGTTADAWFPPQIAEMYRTRVRQVIRTGRTLIAEERSEINGQPVWFSSVVQPVRDRQGQITAAQGVVRDITTLKKAEQALRESEERLRQAVSVADIGMFDHDHVTGTIYWSARQREIFGWGSEEPLSEAQFRPWAEAPPTDADPLYPEDRVRISAAVRHAHHPQSDGRFENEHRIIRRDGSVRWIAVRAQTFFEGDGETRRAVRTIGAVRDVTEAREAEQEQAQLQARLTQSQKMESVGRLAGGVAHDFNNMLNVIQGYAELALAQLTPSDSLYSALEEIQKATQRSADLTRQLLAFARRQTVAPKMLDLNEVVAGSLKMLRRLVGEQVDQVWLPGSELWVVRMDPAQVDQILANLVANARDAIAGVGQVTIRTENAQLDDAYCIRHAGAASGAYVLLEVSDTGSGMDDETVAHMFEPFYTTKLEGQGTGLGLATVYGIVKQNGGFINVNSKPGVGTTVQLFLPRFAGRDEPPGADAHAEAPRAGSETVLLVEDEPMLLKLSQTLLERLGYAVLSAGTPSEALRLAREHSGRIGVLVTDVVMPEMNGRDLARRLTSQDPTLKCLFLSGYSADAMTSGGVLDEGIHFLQKPFSMNDLAAKVREVLGK